MVEPRLNIFMSSTLEIEVGVLDRVGSNFGKPLGFHVVRLILVHQVPKHSHAFNGGNVSFDQEDRIGNVFFNLEVVGYKLLLNHLIFLNNSLNILQP